MTTMNGRHVLTAAELKGVAWRKSSYSGGSEGQCVEVAETPSAIRVRDSKNPDGPSVTLTPAGFSAFTQFAAKFEI